MSKEEKEFDATQSSVAANYARVMNHVVQKGFQMGGVVGVGVVTPILAYLQHQKGRSMQQALPTLADGVGRTAATFVALSVAMGVARLASVEDLKGGVEDRAYRLHYNQGQNRVDMFAQVGLAGGAAAALAFLPATAAVVVGGAAAGAAAGVLAHVATARKAE